MTRNPLLLSVAAFVLAVLLALGTATLLASMIEKRTVAALTEAFDAEGLTWVSVTPDGLRARLAGTAPTESARIRALQVAGGVIDSSRVSEDIVVPVSTSLVAPVFRIELMRDRNDVSVIGLVPRTDDGGPILDRIQGVLPDAEIADMLQMAEHAVPGGWVGAVDFAVQALAMFDVGRISLTAGRIEAEALVESPEAGAALETRLRAIAPTNQVLSLQLTAPRPVAAPFMLRADFENGVLRLGACSADTEQAQARIRAALRDAGMTARFTCNLALGAPSPRWGQAAALSIEALASLGAGSLSLSDGDVSLSAPNSVPAASFDSAVGRLESRLPQAFSLTARRLDPPVDAGSADDGRPELSMILTAEGALTISGRLPDTRIRDAVRAFAQSRFGSQAVEMAARIDDQLPQGWSVRALTLLDALSELHHGSALLLEDRIDVTGVSGNPDAATQVAQALVQGLGADAEFTANITYDELLDPVAQAPTPESCEARIRAIVSETKITFDPGSIEINEQSRPVIDAIAEVLRNCGELPFEIAGHTDSQGRDETNRRLSQGRAEAVVNALMARRVLVSSLVPRGYGADRPVADNGTPEGREANRRIEFTLIRPEPEPVPLDPALEAQLEFEIQTPGDDAIRPRPRP